MKPLPLIISIILLIVSLAKLANSCNKREKRKIAREFNEWVQKVDSRQDSIMMYRYMATDSITWMAEHKKSFQNTLDSAIVYYRDIYMQDERRYKAYLNILFEYKKLQYLYSDWIKTSRIKAGQAKKEEDYHLLTYDEFLSKQRALHFGMSRFNIDVMMASD
jgi:hypothetical protein